MDITQIAADWLKNNPRAAAVMVLVLVVNLILKAVTDALVDVKAEADKPKDDKTGFDKFVTIAGLVSLFVQRVVFHLVGVNTAQLQKLAGKKQ